jgi:rhodanese-related sulfurtransferase
MPRNVPGEPYTRVSAEEANEMVKSGGATVIDVRRDDEYEVDTSRAHSGFQSMTSSQGSMIFLLKESSYSYAKSEHDQVWLQSTLLPWVQNPTDSSTLKTVPVLGSKKDSPTRPATRSNSTRT